MTVIGTSADTGTGATDTPTEVRWEAPDGGLWERETAHYGGISPVPFREELEESFAEGFRNAFARLGVPLSHIELRHVNGWPYVSFFMHDAPRSAGKPPPDVVLKVLSRLHPNFRKRTKIAEAAIAERRAERLADEWMAERDSWIARMRALQRPDLAALDDAALADHLRATSAAVRAGIRRHFELVPGSIPLGHWLVRCAEWDLDPQDGRAAVMHGTPVHEEGRARLRRIVEALGDTVPDDLAAIRAHSDEARTALDDYLEHHGWWATEDSVASTRVLDHPEIILGSIRSARASSTADARDPDEVLAALRREVPQAERDAFDRLARDAHTAYAMLDDNSGITSSWSAGLAAWTLRAVGDRLATNGAIAAAGDAHALTVDQLEELLRGRSTLSSEQVAELAAAWRAQERLDAPMHLNGEPSPPPDPGVFPRPIAHLMTGIGAFLADKFNAEQHTTGIGTTPVTGRAVVTDSPSEALDRLEPGDILITTATTPAYNAVLTLVGGLVVSEGGPSCHAAVVARELGLPTIVGLRDAVTTIPDGATITLDPVRATVSVG